MYLAMNRFKVKKGCEEEFEAVWRDRDSQLGKVDGFVDFHMLKGPEREDYTLYASHTRWQNEDAFIDWTRSEHFRKAHASAGSRKPLYLGPPEFEGFHMIKDI